MFKIKDHAGLVKDPKNGAILLADKTKADEYAARKNMMRTNNDMKTELNTLKADVESVKNGLSEIKELLTKLASGK